ncbi:MAG: PaaI family thioesterase [Pseudomonadota bacterium]
MSLVMTADDLNRFLETAFLEVADEFHVEEVSDAQVVLRLNVSERHLRPGGTISGPAMFGLADVTAYIATLARIGPRALAVTTNCSIDFMRKPAAGVDLLGTGRLLKLGKQLSVTNVLVHSEGMDKPVARASLTYAIPPQGVEV